MSQALFSISFILALYSYFGYPTLLWLLSQCTGRPHAVDDATPAVSVVMAVRNERELLAAKLANLRALDYPPHLLQILVVSDGSTDGTNELLLQEPTPVQAVLLSQAVGKSSALNQVVENATGEILFFCDVRQEIEPSALRRLTRHFGDATVGAVSGELHLEATGDGLGLYWKLEKMVRRLESETGSTVGVTGAIYAMRRSLYRTLPASLVLDDVLVPMNVVRQGYRVLFEPGAVAHDRLFTVPGREFARKVRTLTGNYQLLRLAPWLVTWKNPQWFRFVSHKVSRLLVPISLLGMLAGSGMSRSPLLQLMFLMQVLFFCLALVGLLWPKTRNSRPVRIPYTFVLLNAAASVAMVNALRGRVGNWK